MLKCTGYAEGTTAIHARNSVRVAQTTAISPAAPAHRTAWSATSSNPLGKQNFLRNGERVCANICSGQPPKSTKINTKEKRSVSFFFVPFASARAKLKTPSLNATKARRTRRPNPWRNDPRDGASFDQVLTRFDRSNPKDLCFEQRESFIWIFFYS